jgi:hypothetical protein
MKLIATQTLTSAQPSIQFTSINQTFTDILAVLSLRADAATNEFRLRINGDTGSNYTDRRLFGLGSGSPTSNTSTNNYLRAWGTNPTDYTANTFGNGQLYIPNYTGSAQKSISLDSVTENNSTEAVQNITAGLWTGTAAIDALLFFPSSGNFVAGSTISLYGIGGPADNWAPKATGGVISKVGSFYVHTFTASGTFTPTTTLTDVEYLVVGGGGGGGGRYGAGGGGAGGYRSSVVGAASGGGSSAEARLSLTSGTPITVTVGAGGAGVGSVIARGSSGSNSVFGSITSTGGGGGGANDTGIATGLSGGSGGGGATINATRTGGAGTANQGFAGGTATDYTAIYSAGGGGGAGGAGANGATSPGGVGGVGVSSSITGVAVFRAGGGGGGSQTVAFVAGGNGGGGSGGPASGTDRTAFPGTVNTGGGGGGLGQSSDLNTGTSGAGGSGIVIVRYEA